jgi:hypothetical protein
MHIYHSFGLRHSRNCSVKDGALTWATPLEAGMDTNDQHRKKHVPVQLSYGSEHVSTRFGLVDTRARTPGDLPGFPLQPKHDLFLHVCTLCVVGDKDQRTPMSQNRTSKIRLKPCPCRYCRYACCNIWHSPYAIPLQMKNKSFKISYISILQIDCQVMKTKAMFTAWVNILVYKQNHISSTSPPHVKTIFMPIFSTHMPISP